MALPTGAISLADVNNELGRPTNNPISLGEDAVRKLAGIASGQISLGDLRGKANLIREPETGDLFTNSGKAPFSNWHEIQGTSVWLSFQDPNQMNRYIFPIGPTEYVVGEWTYHRGEKRVGSSLSQGYGVYRTRPG